MSDYTRAPWKPIKRSLRCIHCGLEVASYFADNGKGGALYSCANPGCGRRMDGPSPDLIPRK